MNMEARLLASELLGKYGVLWAHMAAKVEAFHLHLVTTTFGNAVSSTGRAACWTVLITMIIVIWRELGKVRVDSEKSYR